jgi:hypothetical protein
MSNLLCHPFSLTFKVLILNKLTETRKEFLRLHKRSDQIIYFDTYTILPLFRFNNDEYVWEIIYKNLCSSITEFNEIDVKSKTILIETQLIETDNIGTICLYALMVAGTQDYEALYERTWNG